jgi:murein DD-endopeptidase MepM/ murein hydrolase activator NlpD
MVERISVMVLDGALCAPTIIGHWKLVIGHLLRRIHGSVRELSELNLSPIILVTLLSFPLPGSAQVSEFTLGLSPDRVKQGGVSILSIEWTAPIRSLRVWVGGREIEVPSWGDRNRVVLLVGVDLEQAPGSVEVRAEATDARGRSLRGKRALRILDAHYPVQHLTVPRAFVELDAETLERVNHEKVALDRLWETARPDRLWRRPFRLPLDGAGSGWGFGVRRVINGQPRSPHTGTDFSATPGTPVLAANAGVVVLVADHFFAGTSVVLDHGHGLYTMYFHLQESLVREGQHVDQGEAIARVGSSGRATGPHLHWGARLHGARIDPQDLLQISSLD